MVLAEMHVRQDSYVMEMQVQQEEWAKQKEKEGRALRKQK